ncbi:MAG: hypothetical protein JNK85_12835 [Verrucomicrobiales bacterium]|nr:hypothetical protein [Verrucomicrobiales bacterium]
MNTGIPSGRGPISVVAPVGPAIERVKNSLFRPFDLRRWLAIGFTAWLALLADGGGGGGGGGGNFGNRNGGNGVREAMDRAVEYIRDNLTWLVPVVVVGVLVLLAVGLVLLWLSSRGRFMFLHNVATGRADVVAPWDAYAAPAFSLFIFRVIVGFGGLLLLVPLALVTGVSIFRMIQQQAFSPGGLVLSIGAGLAVAVIGLALFLVDKLTKDFVVPVMYLGQTSCRSAWGKFYGLMSSAPLEFAIYLLFHLLLSIAVTLCVVMVVILTCCVAACFLAIPYVGVVLLLPVHMFFRAYSAGYLAQYGEEWDVFRPPTGMASMPPST